VDIADLGWTGPGGFTSSGEDISGLVPGSYTYSWTDVNGCTLGGSVLITGPDELQLVVTATAESCFGMCDGALDAASLNASGPPAFSLSPPEWEGSHFTGLCGGTYTVYAVDGNGCTAQLQADVPAGPEGANAAILPVGPMCIYDPPVFLQSVDPGGTWSGPGIIDPLTGLFHPATAGVGDASIVHVMDGSCNGPGTAIISVLAPPVPAFDVEVHGPVGIEVIVSATNRTDGAMAFLWSLDGVMIATSTDLEYRLPAVDATLHTLCLIAVNEAGCSDTLCRSVTAVNTTDIFVPNSFTPDGDGFNDAFGAVVRGIEPQDGVLQIFDRWGELIFSGEGLSRARWDGTCSGTEVGSGVYVWRIAYHDLGTRREVSRIGHVTLLR
jgi:gliding motility-associated-like protein